MRGMIIMNKRKVIKMKKIILFLFIVLLLSACDDNGNVKETLNEHGQIKNINALESFIINFNNNKQDQVNYVALTEEGKRLVWALKFQDDVIMVEFSRDKKVSEEYKCENIEVSSEEDIERYTLIDCSGDISGDYELLAKSGGREFYDFEKE